MRYKEKTLGGARVKESGERIYSAEGDQGKQIAIIEDEQEVFEADEALYKLIEKAALACLKHENFLIGCKIVITLTDDKRIKEINKEFRNMDSPTDVLSFPMAEIKNGELLGPVGDYDLDDNMLILGDLIISMETAARQAAEYGHSIEREVAFLTTHGVYHLLGYDHMDPDSEKAMIAKQEEVLDIMGLKRQ